MKSERGFTLVELMISLVLFSFAIAGVLSVAVSMSQAFREQRQIISTETSVRAPMEYIADAIRNASPGISTGTVSDVATCTQGVITVTNSTTGPDQLDLVYANGAVVTSLRSTYDVGTTAITVTDASQLLDGDTLLITDTTQGHLVQATTVNQATGVISLQGQGGCAQTIPAGGYPPGSLVIRAKRARFYIDPNGALGDGVPSLMYVDPTQNPLAPEPLADNIEDMQIALGVDVDGSKGIDSGEWAYSQTGVGALVGSIRAIRITLIARAPQELGGAVKTFTRPNTEDRTDIAASDAYRRRVLSTTVEIRNLGGSP